MIRSKSIGGKVFDSLNILFMCLVVIVTLYPLMYVVFASFSDPVMVRTKGGILLWPLNPTIEGYKIIFRNPQVFTGFKNTLFYVVAGTAVNIFLTSLGAYVLSRKNFMPRNAIMFMIVFTMFFSGGLIPTFFVVRNIGLLGSRWALIIPSAIAAWNLIIMRTSFMTIPYEIEESAKMDGANDFTILFRIILPLSTAIVAVMALFYGVAHWNDWFTAVIYLRDRDKYPIQLFLREILILNNIMGDPEGQISRNSLDSAYAKMIVKYAIIVIATVPILCVYPFLQKYFVKGIMIGSLKG